MGVGATYRQIRSIADGREEGGTTRLRRGSVLGCEVAEGNVTVAARFFAAVNTRDVQQLMDLMAPDVVLLTDGGGKKQAALRPILGADKVSRWFRGVTPKAGDVSYEWAVANGAPAAFISIDGELDSVASLTVTDGRIAEIYLVRNPVKLTAVRETFRVTRG